MMTAYQEVATVNVRDSHVNMGFQHFNPAEWPCNSTELKTFYMQV